MQESLQAALEKAVKESKAPGAVAYVGTCAETILHEAAGYRQTLPIPLPAEKDTIYDLASLTKVVATTTAIMLLRDAGALSLDQPVFELVPIPEFKNFTIRHLLTHTSGLVAVRVSWPLATASLIARDFSVEIVATRSTASAKLLQSTSRILSLPDGMTRS